MDLAEDPLNCPAELLARELTLLLDNSAPADIEDEDRAHFWKHVVGIAAGFYIRYGGQPQDLGGGMRGLVFPPAEIPE